MSRTNRKPYTKAKAVDAKCRCNGGCPYCEGNRLNKTRADAKAKDKEIKDESD